VAPFVSSVVFVGRYFGCCHFATSGVLAQSSRVLALVALEAQGGKLLSKVFLLVAPALEALFHSPLVQSQPQFEYSGQERNPARRLLANKSVSSFDSSHWCIRFSTLS
jgi:hypothetical protein